MPAFASSHYSLSDYDTAGETFTQADSKLNVLPRLSSQRDISFKLNVAWGATAQDELYVKALPRFESYPELLLKVIPSEEGQVVDYKDGNLFQLYVNEGKVAKDWLFTVNSKYTENPIIITTSGSFSYADYNSDYDIGEYYENIVKTDSLFKVTPSEQSQLTSHIDSLFKVSPTTTPVQVCQPDFSFEDYDECYAICSTRLRKIDEQFTVLPRFNAFSDGFYFQLFVKKHFDCQLFTIIVPEPTGTIVDPILEIMLMLKNNWNLTASGLTSGDITFSTGWYDNNIAFPQITVTPSYSVKTILTTGDTPIYQYRDGIHVDIWVRPYQDSGKSLGEAKDKEYKIRREVERILRTGSHIGQCYNNQEFIYISRTRILDETGTRPPLLRSSLEVIDNYFRQDYGFNRNYGEV